MNNEQDNLMALLCRYAAGRKLTRREKDRLRQWSVEHGQPLDLQPDPTLLRDLEIAEQGKAAAWERFKARSETVIDIDRATVGRGPAAIRFLTSPWLAYAAIALVLLVVFFLLRSPQHGEKAVKVTQGQLSDRAPGSYKAVLTLAEGASIYLGAGHTADIPPQGNDRAIRLGDSGLVYQPGTAPATGKAMHLNELTTPRGGTFWLRLADSSLVRLNAATVLRYPSSFTGDVRQVEIVSGEAYFDVRHDRKKPFRVTIPGGRIIEATGTRFNVNTYGDKKINITTLVDGRITLSTQGKPLEIHPGQQVLTGDRQKDIVRNTGLTAARRTIAWAGGYFDFDETSFDDVMKQLGRWYNVDIDNRTTQGQEPVSLGPVTMKKTLKEMLGLLQELTPFEYTLTNGKVLLYNRK